MKTKAQELADAREKLRRHGLVVLDRDHQIEKLTKMNAALTAEVRQLTEWCRAMTAEKESLASDFNAKCHEALAVTKERDEFREKYDSTLQDVAYVQERLNALSGANIDHALSRGHLKGIAYVLTRLVLAGDVEAAKVVARGIAAMVAP